MKRKSSGGLALLCSSVAVFAAGCGSSSYEPSEFHITKEKVEAEAPRFAGEVPRLVRRTAAMPTLEYSETQQTVDVVVHNVPVRDLIFALARDLELNADVDAKVTGIVSISAFDQTFEKILERLSRQLPIRYEFVGDTVVVVPDEPYMKQYQIDYLNITRTYTSDSSASSVEPTDGESGGSGSASISNSSESDFWNTLDDVLGEIVDDTYDAGTATNLGDEALEVSDGEHETLTESTYAIDPDTGIVIVVAPDYIQRQVQTYLDTINEVVQRQVLLEATVVEVLLNNNYNQGIDWSVFDPGAREGLFVSQGSSLSSSPAFPGSVLQHDVFVRFEEGDEPGELGEVSPAVEGQINTGITNPRVIARNIPESLFFGGALRIGDLEAAVHLLQKFGTAKVVSSPRLSALNNQGALLKVVDNQIYFTLEVDEEETESSLGDATSTARSIQTEETTVPVGFSMNVLPQISSDGRVMLNLKPSITRVIGSVPIPSVSQAGVAVGARPIVRVREFESVLSLHDGEAAVLGGFIEDTTNDTRTGLPGAMDLPGIGSLFENNSEVSQRTQLIVFIKATVINNPSLNGDYAEYRDLLPDTNFVRRSKGNVLFDPDQKEVD